MLATPEKIKGYNHAFDILCKEEKGSPVIKNALLLCNYLQPAIHIFACCYGSSSIIALHKEMASVVGLHATNFYTPFLFNQSSNIILPDNNESLDLPAGYHFAGIPLQDEEGVAFGKIGWINSSATFLTTTATAALEQATQQLASLIIATAADIKSHQQLQYYFDTSPLAIIEWDSSLKVSQWSSRAEALFGWKKEEVFGLTFYDFNIVHPESKPALDELVRNTVNNTDEIVVIENKNYTKSGVELFCRWHNTVKREKDGKIKSVFAMVENITSLALVNKNLQKSIEKIEENETALNKINELNKAIVAALPDLMFRLTKEGIFADYYFSDIESSPLFLQPGDFIGKKAKDILPPEIVRLLHQAFKQIALGQKIALFNYELATANGIKQFESRVTSINQSEYLCIIRDITVAKKAERQIVYKNELLDAVAQIGNLLLSSQEWHVVFEKSLAVIGNAFKVSRVYFLQVITDNNSQQLLLDILYEWVAEGFQSRMNHPLFKNIRMAENPDLWDHLQLNKIFAAVKIKLENGYLKQVMEELENEAVIMLPLVINEQLFGVIALDECTCSREWSREERATLSIITNNLIASHETQKTQRSIKKANELFGYVMKATNDLIWDWDIVNNIIERSENGFKNVTGYEYAEIKQTVDFWPVRLHPEERDLMLINFTAALNNPAVSFWENNFRFLKKDGSYSYLTDRCYIIRNEEGKAIRAIGATQDITEQKKAVIELANSEQRFRSMIHNISDIITLISKDGIILYRSASAERILGFDDGEAVGKTVFQMVHPGDVEKVINFFKNYLLKEGNSPPVQFRYLTKDGTYLFLEAIGNNQLSNPAINAIIVISRDVTERIKAEEAIRSSEEKFRSLVHNISDVISIISPTGQMLYQSSPVKQLPGYMESDFSTSRIAEIIHPEDFPQLIEAFNRLIKTGGTSEPMEFRILNKDGNYVYIEAQATNQIDNPTIQGIVVTSRDISQRKKTELERKLLIEELTKNNADLKQFSYIVSHDLRAPLTNLISMINLLDFGTIQHPRSLKLLEGFKISTFKLRDTLNDLTDVLVVKNNTNVELKTLNFNEVFLAVKQSVSSLVEKSGAAIYTDFSAAPFIKFSEPYLESIFQNLLTNSIRYAAGNRLLQINVVTKKAEDNIVITFADNGIGFNMNVVKDKIFGLHQRFHHHPESRGIGLYLIHSQITSLGGSITVYSEEDAGTVFSITLKN